MKWAVSKKRFDAIPERFRDSYVVLDPVATGAVAAKSAASPPRENEWAKHEFDFFDDQEYYQYFRRAYELFCGGWLSFYEREVKSGDYTISFEWGTPRNGKGTVSVYLFPKPKKMVLSDQDLVRGKVLPPALEVTDPPVPPPPPPPAPERLAD